jgi:putative OPT family oligopeptide transporter
MLAIGSSACAFVLAPVLSLLNKAYGIGVPTPEHPNPLLAPQATLMASVSKGMFGGSLPWNMVAIGAAIGIAIILLDETLIAKKIDFRVPVLAAAVGIYLPIDVTMPIFLGGLLAWFAERRIRARAGGRPLAQEELDRMNRRGTLFAAGMITGEALTGIIIAIPIVVSGRADVLALPASLHFGQWLGLIIVGLMAWWLYRTASPAAESA